MAVKQLSALIHGRVQGVGYRFFAAELARELGIVGYVRNTSSGDVEILAEAEEGLLAKFLGELRAGPPHSIIDDIHHTWTKPTRRYDRFYIKP